MRRTLPMAAVLLAASALVACSAPERGVVIGKHYTPPSTWTTTVCAAYYTKTTVYRSGKRSYSSTSRTCVAYAPQVHHRIAEWYLTLRDGDDQGDRVVYRIAWERCAVGSLFPTCAETSPNGGEA